MMEQYKIEKRKGLMYRWNNPKQKKKKACYNDGIIQNRKEKHFLNYFPITLENYKVNTITI